MTDFISLPETIKQKIYQNLFPCDLIQLGSTCKNIHNSIYEDNLLVQLSLIDHYQDYAKDDESKQLLDFDTLRSTKATDCLNNMYPKLVKNCVKEQITHFPSFNVFIPTIPNELFDVLLFYTLIFYFSSYLAPLSAFTPLCLLLVYYRNIKNQLQSTIDLLLHPDRIIRERLFLKFIEHTEILIPLFAIPFLLLIVFIHPIFLCAPFVIFHFEFSLKPKVIPTFIGYFVSIIPVILASFSFLSPALLVGTSLSSFLPLVIIQILNIYNKPIELSDMVIRLVIGLFVGGFVGLIYSLSFNTTVMGLFIIALLSGVTAISYPQLKR